MEQSNPDATVAVEPEATVPMTDGRFLFGTPDNFSMLIGRQYLSVIEGRPCQVEPFRDPEEERQWLRWQIVFHRQVMERLERYAQLRLAELDKVKATL